MPQKLSLRIDGELVNAKEGETFDAISRAAMYGQLQAISAMTAPRLFFPKSAATESHRAYVHHLIDAALDTRP